MGRMQRPKQSVADTRCACAQILTKSTGHVAGAVRMIMFSFGPRSLRPQNEVNSFSETNAFHVKMPTRFLGCPTSSCLAGNLLRNVSFVAEPPHAWFDACARPKHAN